MLRPRPRARTAIAGGSLGLLLTGALLALAPAPANGHALLRTSVPADGEEIDAAPESVSLSFTEPPDPSLSTIRVVGTGGAEFQAGEPQTAGARELRLPVRPLEEGVYSVTWRVVSEVDGHPSAGIFTFGVGVPATAAPGVAPPTVEIPETSPLEIVARVLLFAGLGSLMGAAAIGSFAFPSPPRPVILLAVGGGVVGVMGMALLAMAQRSAAGVGYGDLLATPIGRSLVWRMVAGIVALVAAILARFWGRRGRAALAVSAVAGAVAMFAHVSAGHAGAEGAATIQVVGQWAHVVAAAVWLGGLAALILAIRGEPREEKTRAARRFSAAAGIALAVVLGTGVVRSLEEVGSWDGLFSTGYGQLVLIKVGLILVLAGLGALNRYRHVQAMRSSTSPLRRVGRFELVVAVGAIAAAAALASLVPPASVPAAAGRPAAIVVRSSDFATSVRGTLEVDPGLPGPNVFSLRLEDYDTGEPVEAQTVSLRFQPLGRSDVGETTLDLAATDDGAYTASGPNLSTGGPWDLVAVVQRGADAVEMPFQASTLCPTQTVEEEGKPTIHLFQSPSGGTSEGYLIPLGGPRYEVHFTFIDPKGKESRVGELTMSAFRSDSGLERLEPIQLTKGHFLAEATLEPGDWRFDGVAEIGGGETSSGCFEETL